MHAKTALLTLALLASILVPAATARGVEGLQGQLEGGLVDLPGEVPASDPGLAVVPDGVAPLPSESLDRPLDAATSLVGDPVDVSLSVQAEANGEGVGLGVSTSAVAPAEPPSLGERAAAVAVPVAGAGLVAASLGAVAFGVEGLRAFQLRLTGGIARAVRFIGAGLAGAIPLFSRIERGGALDNPVRARVHDAIAQEPGLSLSDVAQRAGIAWGTAVHHLRRLESLGLVVSTRDLAHHRFFIANTPAAAQRAAVVAVMHPTARRIAEYVTQRPGTDQAGLCQALGLNNPAASKHLGQFEARGLVLSQRSGRSRLYHATGGLHSALQLLEPAPVAAIPVAPSPAARPMVVAMAAT